MRFLNFLPFKIKLKIFNLIKIFLLILLLLNLIQLKNEIFNGEDETVLNSRLIFIGGFARSGTTLMRALLDAHPSISCGPETKIVPSILNLILKHELRSTAQLKSATAAFVYYILENHIRNAKRLCDKDPDIVYYLEYLHSLFPKAKFIFMVRDGRAASYSLMQRFNASTKNYVLNVYLRSWSLFNVKIYNQCLKVGENVCKIVKYESLVLNTKVKLEEILQFLGEKWSDNLLRHHEFFKDRIKVSKTEWSTDQIMRPIYTSALKNWINKIEYDEHEASVAAPMLNEFGYSLNLNNLNYEKLV